MSLTPAQEMLNFKLNLDGFITDSESEEEEGAPELSKKCGSEDNKVKDTCFKQGSDCETKIADLSMQLSSLQKKLARLCKKKPKGKE